MWKRKELKKQARKTLKRNYFAAIGVCFIMMMFFDRYGISKQAISIYNPTQETQEPVVEQNSSSGRFAIWENLLEDISHRVDQKRETDPGYATKGVLSTLLNHLTQKTGPVFKVIGSVDSFIRHHISEGISFLISTMLSILVMIFVIQLIQIRRYAELYICLII